MHVRVVAAVALSVALGRQVEATDVLRNGAWAANANCVDHAWNSDYAYIYQCHGEPNQQWELTSDSQLRTAEGNCMEYFDDSDQVAIVPCDVYRRQRWYVTDGFVKPQGFRLSSGAWSMRIGWCLEATQPDGKLALRGCHGAQTQKFSASFFPTDREDVLQVGGPWNARENCIDYDYSSRVAYVYACHGQWNQRWRASKLGEVRVGADQCLEFDASTKQVTVPACTGASNQKWLVRDDSLVQAVMASSSPLCLQVPHPTTRLSLAACAPSQPTQQFTSTVLMPKVRGLLTLAGPWKESLNCIDYAWGTDYAYVYDCHGKANQLWEFTTDQQVRTADNKCLEFDDVLDRAYVRTCDAANALQKWSVKPATGEISPRAFFTASGVWRQPAKCLDAALEDGKLHLWDCHGGDNQRFRSEVFPSVKRDLVFTTGGQSGANCVRSVDGLVLVTKCGTTREMLWELAPEGFLRVQLTDSAAGTLCLTGDPTTNSVSTSACSGAATQQWERTVSGGLALRATALAWNKCLSWEKLPVLSLATCSANSTTQQFTSTLFDGASDPSTSPQFVALLDAAQALSLSVKQDVFLTTNVLARASSFVGSAFEVLATPDASRATDFIVQFLSKSDNTTRPLIAARSLYATSESEEFLLTLATLLQSDQPNAAAVLRAAEPALRAFSDQLLQARYDALLDHVVRGDLGRLEAYTDGSLSDFAQVGGLLRAVCDLSKAAQGLAMCRLATYFSLIDEFFLLKYKLLVDGPRSLSQETLAQAAKVAGIFKDNQVAFAQDKLWARLMTLLLLGSPFVDVVPPQTLARASDAFLPTFVLFVALGTNPAFLQQVDPMVRFLSDQITTFHINNLLTIITSQDTDALESYLAEPFGGFYVANTSDFTTVATYVAPRVCNDAARVSPLSLCRLPEFHSGLISVLRFKHALRRSDREVSLADLREVDVRKKLDVLDAEKKHFEMLSTLRQAANQIGVTLTSGFRGLSEQINASTSAIRADIEASRQDIRAAVGDVGGKLQDAIATSTDILYTQVGQKAAEIRGDIAESTRELRDRLDDTGRAILGSIEQSKQELKTQIGAQAEATRELITAKTQELKTHMTQETQGLREFIDDNTKLVIGVVRDEGKLTRQAVDDAAGQIINTVEKEGAITRAYVDTKTNEIKSVVVAESAKTREFVDQKTNQVIKVVQDEARTTRSFIDEKGNQVIAVVKDEGEQTRKEVRATGDNIRATIDKKSEEIKSVVRDTAVETRAEVTKQSAALQQHMTNEAGGIKTAVADAQAAILGKSEQQFTALTGQIGGVRSDLAASSSQITGTIKDAVGVLGAVAQGDCVTFKTANIDFENARKVYTTSLTALTSGIKSYAASDPVKNDATAPVAKVLVPLAQTVVQTVAGSSDGSTTAPPGEAKASGQLEAMLPNLPELMIAAAAVVATVAREAVLKIGLSPTVWQYYFSLTLDQKTALDNFGIRYEAFAVEVPEAAVLGLFDIAHQKTEGACNDLKRLCVPPCLAPPISCTAFTAPIDKLKTSLQTVLTAHRQMREALARAVAAGVRCDKGQKAVDWSKATRRRLATTDDEPYFAMTATALTTILLDYQLQEAAFQFCKYYEFKNGGVAPSMCRAGEYFTKAQIQEMRAWQPAPQRRLTKRLLLPTQSAVQAGSNNSYPFVNVAALRDGNAVLFTPPTWDLEWLKRYGWVLSNAKEETFPSYYVESARLYLPIQTNDTTGAAATAAFTVTATMEALPDQFPSWALRKRTYRLPVQGFSFDATYGEPFCVETNRQTNPYHASAECVVTAGRKSELCALSDGSTGAGNAQSLLLPSLFATWRISADYDRKDALFSLAEPFEPLTANVSAAPFNLFADVTLVQATTSTSPSLRSEEEGSQLEAATPSTCCASDEYKTLQGACVKCPPGAKAALNGYTCSA